MYRVTISKVMAGRHEKGEDLTHYIEEAGNNPRFGFYWWFWTPRVSSNGGSFKSRQVVDIDAHWLCFSLGLIFWPT